MTYRKSTTSFWLAPKSVTLNINDLEGQNKPPSVPIIRNNLETVRDRIIVYIIDVINQ